MYHMPFGCRKRCIPAGSVAAAWNRSIHGPPVAIETPAGCRPTAMTSSETVPGRPSLGRYSQALWLALQLTQSQMALGAEAADGGTATIETVSLPEHATMCTGSHSHVRPEPQDLEAAGARIGQIDIDVEDIFDTSDPKEDCGALSARQPAAHQHAGRGGALPAAAAARRITYSQQKVDETERLLRGRRYIYDAWIEPVCYHDDDRTVDMNVRVRDVWSLNPGVSYTHKGGASRVRAPRSRTRTFSAAARRFRCPGPPMLDRTTMRARLRGSTALRQLVARAGSPSRTTATVARPIVAVGRPFYSLDTRWSAGTEWLSDERDQSRYQLGHVADEFAVRERQFDLSGGVSSGLRDGWTRRWLAGLRYDSSEFTPTDALVAGLPAGPPARLSVDRRRVDRERLRHGAQL